MEDKMLKEIDKQINIDNNRGIMSNKLTVKDTKYSFIFLKYFLPIILIIVLKINNFIKSTVLFIVILSIFSIIGVLGFYVEVMEITKNKKNVGK